MVSGVRLSDGSPTKEKEDRCAILFFFCSSLFPSRAPQISACGNDAIACDRTAVGHPTKRTRTLEFRLSDGIAVRSSFSFVRRFSRADLRKFPLAEELFVCSLPLLHSSPIEKAVEIVEKENTKADHHREVGAVAQACQAPK